MTQDNQTPPATQPSATVGEVERLAKVYAEATGYYVPFHPGLSSPSADNIRKGIRAVLATLHTPPPVATATVDADMLARMAKKIEGWDKEEDRSDWWQWQHDFAAAHDLLADPPTPPAGDK